MYKKREAEASLVLHAAFFLEEVPCTDSDGVHSAFLVGIQCATAARNCSAIVRVRRANVIPLNSEPHGRVNIIGEVGNVTIFTLDCVSVGRITLVTVTHIVRHPLSPFFSGIIGKFKAKTNIKINFKFTQCSYCVNE